MIEENKRRYRLAILASHPIQYQAPLFRALAAHPELDVTVFFCSDWGLKPYHDGGFGRQVKWDVPLTDGYAHEFLSNISLKPNPSNFAGLINPGIIKRLKRGKFHAVMIHGWSRVTFLLAMSASTLFKIPVLMRGESNLLRNLSPRKAAIKRFLLSRLFKRTAGFLAIGRYNTEFYQYYGVQSERIFHVPYAIDNDYFSLRAAELLPQKAALKKQLGIAAELPAILFSGKLMDVKRPMDLLLAHETVVKTRKAALVYLGDGELRASLEAYVKEKNLPDVHFVGFHNQTELPKFFAAADIFVLPSMSETWGLVINEALCFGLPVIVSDRVGATGDLVRDSVNGFIYEAANPAVLAEKLETLLSDENLRRRMGEASKSLIANWSLQEDVQGILSCLKQVVR